MEKLLELVVTWIEYFKKKDEILEKRLGNIEEYLESSTETNFTLFVKRLEALEKEGVKDDTGTTESVE